MDSIEYYNKNASAYYENTLELDLGDVLEHFTELLPESASVLDLGCGSGRDSLSFIEQGFDVTAMDGSEEMCELASIQIGQDVLLLRFDEIDFKQVFDGIWANASLLHVSDEDMPEILDKVVDSLKPDGILYMSFLFGEFSGFRNQRYFNDYTTKKLRNLLEQHSELEVLEISKVTSDDKENKTWIRAFARKKSEDEKEE